MERYGSAAVQDAMTVHVGAPEAVTLQLRCSLPQLAGPCQLKLGRCKQLRILPCTLWLAGGQQAHCNGRLLHRADNSSVVALVSDLFDVAAPHCSRTCTCQAFSMSDNPVTLHESRGL